ncbi:MAG TPA: NAD(+)/NADH kinase [Ottowia sp.]|uniref:NAD(+)/NADH kinase n=1 Tax=Ottowia sp. TaxID=1898956 RepID=UPI002CB48A66|nr:NAD(+)/NADH kinase [Ottowia sp.]HMN22615.1 NAD(+)/NADH kinase [Ottowia sp.]
MLPPDRPAPDPDGPTSIGVIANPSSGRDVRRLLGWASVFPVSEKVNVVLRLLSALGSLGVEQAWMLPDAAGIASRVREAADLARSRHPMPQVRLLEMPIHDAARDSAHAAAALADLGVGLIAVLGGDGTHRAVAAHCGEVPLATLSTGTNNAFPRLREATLVGVAAGLLVTGRVPPELGLRRNKCLRITGRGTDELALVDVCVSRELARGAGAIGDGAHLSEMFVAFAEPAQIGLSSIAGLSCPVSRDDPFGLHLQLGSGRTLQAPLLPGVLQPVSIAAARRLLPGRPVPVHAARGTLVVDGERLIEFDDGHALQVELELQGPRTLDVEAVLEVAARRGLLFDVPGPLAPE